METRLVKLKSDFNDIINVRNTVKNVFDILQIRIDRLHQMYAEFIKTNQSEMFVFGLDSFHFQSKLIGIEYDDMKRLFLVINNRMYCEYFKLHKIIVEYISKNVTDKKVSDLVKINKFPIYKDLEPFKEYKFEIILDIHENILNLLGMLMSILFNKENELSIHKTKQNIGLNIDNFITTFNFNINVMREKILMFITYIEFFHKMHSKYLKRFSNKIQLMYTHISNDIKFEDSVEMSKNKKKELIGEFITGNMDKTLLKELKTSIGSETNSEISCDGSKSSTNSPTSQSFDVSESLLSLAFPSSMDTNNQVKSMSLLNSMPLSLVKEKKDYKNLFQRNVHKVTNLLQLCKPKQEKPVEFKVTDKEIEDMFYDIEESCDSIINEKPQDNLILEQGNIGLHMDSFDKEDTKINSFITINPDENKVLNIENREKISEQSDIVIETFSIEETKSLDEYVLNQEPISVVIEEQLPVVIEEQLPVVIEEQLPVVIEDQVPVVIEDQVLVVNKEKIPLVIEDQVLVKKKRTYNRKKK
jgi:hypothetical protein